MTGEVSCQLNGVHCVSRQRQCHWEQGNRPQPTSEWHTHTHKLRHKGHFSPSFYFTLPQTDAGRVGEHFVQWCEELYLNLCCGYRLTRSKLHFFSIVHCCHAALNSTTMKYWLSWRMLNIGLSTWLFTIRKTNLLRAKAEGKNCVFILLFDICLSRFAFWHGSVLFCSVWDALTDNYIATWDGTDSEGINGNISDQEVHFMPRLHV